MVYTEIGVMLQGQPTSDMIESIMAPQLASVTMNCVAMVVFLILFMVVVIALLNKIGGTKSRRYRELLSDMYVVGKIKKIAKEDDIDVIKELSDWAKIDRKASRKEKLLYKSIDEVVANNLKEKIDAKNDELIDKMEEDSK